MHSNVPDELAQGSAMQLNALSHPYDNSQVCHLVVCSIRRGNDFSFCEILRSMAKSHFT